MAQVKIYNLEGVAVGDMELDAKIFSETGNSELFYQVVRVLQANSRTVLAHTKDRSQVRGGGKKPWAQKGTGRARHGSIRSPIWVGGGITFGPTAERNFSLAINRKMVKKAIRAAVSARVSAQAFYVLDDITLAEPATKKFVLFLKKLGLSAKKVLFLTDKNMANAILSVRNMPKINAVRLENLNLLELMKHDNILIAKDTVAKLAKQIAK